MKPIKKLKELILIRLGILLRGFGDIKNSYKFNKKEVKK